MAAALKRFLAGPLPVLGVFLLLSGSLGIMAAATQSSEHFYRWQWWAIGLNSALGAILLVLIGSAAGRLARQLRRRETGSRLSLRMAVMFAGFTLVPTSMVFGFSIWLLSTGVDSWFDVGVDDALDKAGKLSRSSIDAQLRQRRDQIERLLQAAGDVRDSADAVALTHDLVQRTGALEATLFDAGNQILAAQSEAVDIAIDRPDEARLQLLREHGAYLTREQHPEHGAVSYVLLELPSLSRELPLVLQARYPTSEHMAGLADSIERAADTYRRLLELRLPLKYNLTLVLSLALLLGLLFAVWAALYSAQRILAPIPELARGFEAVASGEYGRRLPADRRDELGHLAHAFNRMTERLANSRYIAETRRLTIKQQSSYLNTLLEHLSSGVISIDADGVLMTANRAAGAILGLNLQARLGQPLPALRRLHPNLEPLWRLLDAQHRSAPELERQLQLDGERKTLLCHGARLPQQVGCVVVFEDITDLQQAQRQAAWGEIARRLAHEIKNPLTPIRLSAERLQRKLEPELAGDAAELLRRAAHTIVQQVESMRLMLNDFSQYAAAEFQPEPIELDAVARAVLDLYLETSAGISIRPRLGAAGVRIDADPGRLRQLLHNLLKNALEAQAERIAGFVELRTERRGERVALTVRDAGPGFAADVIGRVFEPYVTTKPGGNGLGLAVVHKIVQDHGGGIRVYNDPDAGGCVEILFPARRNAPAAPLEEPLGA